MAAAQIQGTVRRCVVGERITGPEAIVEMGEALAELPAAWRQEVLDQAAAQYVRPSAAGDEHWFPAALALMVEAGADEAAARAIRAARREVRGLSGLGEQDSQQSGHPGRAQDRDE